MDLFNPNTVSADDALRVEIEARAEFPNSDEFFTRLADKLRVGLPSANTHVLEQFDYEIATELNDNQYPFYALVGAAMLRADGVNLRLLSSAFPMLFSALQPDLHKR